MGHTQAQKAANRERIVGAAARHIREEGLERPAIADLMREVGLTHGGFYKQFSSRSELMTEAIEQVMGGTAARFSGITRDTPDPLAAVAEAYVCAAHRDDVAGGCGLPSLGAEMSHAEDRGRRAYAAQVDEYIDALALVDGADRDLAMVRLSAMVGSLLLSRALTGSDASDEVLRAVRTAFTSSDGALRPAPDRKDVAPAA